MSSPSDFTGLRNVFQACEERACRLCPDQLCSVQQQRESLQEQRKLELRSAQEEVLLLQQSAQEAAEERENDIASLQEELCRLSAQLQHLRRSVQDYDLEATTLRAETGVKSHSQDLNLAGRSGYRGNHGWHAEVSREPSRR